MYTLKPNGYSSNSKWSTIENMYNADENAAATCTKSYSLFSSSDDADVDATLILDFTDMLNTEHTSNNDTIYKSCKYKQ